VPGALDVARAIGDMLEDGEATQPASWEAAACLDATVVEAARAAELDW